MRNDQPNPTRGPDMPALGEYTGPPVGSPEFLEWLADVLGGEVYTPPKDTPSP